MLNDIMKWKMGMLAKFGGYSHRYIASVVFEKPLNKVNESEKHSVSSWLSRNQIKVIDWRNGISSQSVSYAKKVVKPKRKLVKARKKSRNTFKIAARRTA